MEMAVELKELGQRLAAAGYAPEGKYLQELADSWRSYGRIPRTLAQSLPPEHTFPLTETEKFAEEIHSEAGGELDDEVQIRALQVYGGYRRPLEFHEDVPEKWRLLIFRLPLSKKREISACLNRVTNVGIETVGELREWPLDELETIRQMGSKRARFLQSAFKKVISG